MAEVVLAETSPASKLATMQVLIASGGTWYHPTLHLGQTAIPPGYAGAPSGITEANFDGYSAIPSAAWEGAYIGEDGFVHATLTSHLFEKTAGSVPNTILSAYITDTAGTTYLAGGNLDTPANLNATNQALDLVFDTRWGF